MRDKVSLIKHLESYHLQQSSDTPPLPELPESFLMAWIFHDNHLEGRSLNPQDIRVAVQSRDAERPSYLRPLLEDIRLYQEAIKTVWALGQQGPKSLTQHNVKKLHKHLMTYDPKEGASFRQNSPVHRDYHHKICPHTSAPRLLQELCRELSSFDPLMQDALSYAAYLHHKFMYIYPFRRAPGSLARLFTNQFLIAHNYPPLLILSHERGTYYDALSAPDHQALTQLFQKAAWRFIEVYPTLQVEAQQERAKRLSEQRVTTA